MIQLNGKSIFLNGSKTEKNRADSAVLLFLEPFKNIDFQRSYGRFSETGVNFFVGHQVSHTSDVDTTYWKLIQIKNRYLFTRIKI